MEYREDCGGVSQKMICTFTKSFPHKDHRALDLISDVLPFGRLWYGEPNANRQCNRLRDALQPFT